MAQKTTWEKSKGISFKIFGGLLMEKKDGEWLFSVGRVSWWLAFAPALNTWISSDSLQDITPHHLTLLLILAGYNFGKKALDKLKKTEPEAEGPG